MEESELMNPVVHLPSGHEIDVRNDKQGHYDNQSGPKSAKQGLVKGYFQKKYWICFTVILLILVALVLIHLYLKIFIKGQRANSFEHNLKVLQKYQQRSVQQQPPNLQDQSQMHLTSDENSQPTQTTAISQNNQIIENSFIHLNDHIQSPPESTQSSIKVPLNQEEATVDNPFLSSNLPSSNTFDYQGIPLDQSFINGMAEPVNTQQDVVLSDQYRKNVEEASIPTFAFESRADWVDYADYTGIEMGQVANSISWMQSKFDSLLAINPAIDAQRAYYEQKYGISQYKELPFCIVVPSFNNAADNRHINNMNSILMQEYSNYHVVFIDDASSDSTAEDVTKLMDSQRKLPDEQYVILRNSKQMKAMHNLRMAANQYCKQDDIFMVVDGDDELIGRQVLKLFNSVFQTSGSWFVYSNFLTAKNYVGFSRVVPPSVIADNSFRKYPFVTSHLRVFFTQLFRNIKEEDLRNTEGEYLSAANDVAICMPILEQAQQRISYIPQLTYFYNSETGLNNHALRLREQKLNELRLRGRQSYQRLQQLFPEKPPA